MKCTDVRWQLTRFMSGETPSEVDDEIRSHIDACPDCALRLASRNTLQSIKLESQPSLKSNMVDRILAYYPESATGMMVVRHLSWVFAISASFAVGVYMLVRWLLSYPVRSELNPNALVTESGISQWITSASSNPTVNFIVLGVAVAVISVALILIIDRPHGDMGEAKR